MKVADMLGQIKGIDPRGDSFADLDLTDQHCTALAAIFDQDKDEYDIAVDLRAYVAEHLQPDLDLYIAVNDRHAARKIISKLNFKKYMSLVLEV